MEDQELFKNYEIKGLRIDSRLSTIVGATVLFHAIAITLLGQLNLLQTKACDSPYIGRVCQVLDVAYVGSIIMGKDYDYVNQEYEKTEIDASDVTFIEVTEPFEYPQGYFAVSNPETQNPKATGQIINNFPNFAPGIPNSGSNILNAPQVVPTPNKNAVVGKIPDSPFSVEENPSVGRVKTPKYPRARKADVKSLPGDKPHPLPHQTALANGSTNSPLANSGNSNVAKNPTNAAPTVTNSVATNANEKPKVGEDGFPQYEINKRPLQDYGRDVKSGVAKKEVDLSLPFSVAIKGLLKKDGKLDTRPGVTGYTSKPIGDEKLVNVVKSGVEAVNASGYLQYLKDLSGKDLRLEISQDDKQIIAVIHSELESDERARSISGALNLIMSLAKMKKSESTEQDDKDDLALLQNSKVTAKGRTFELRFEIPREVAQDLINRKLASLKDADEEKKSNSNSVANLVGANKIAAK